MSESIGLWEPKRLEAMLSNPEHRCHTVAAGKHPWDLVAFIDNN